MRKIRNILKIVFIIPFILLSACKEKENVAPTVEIVTPQDGATVLEGEIIPVKAMADDELVATEEASTVIYNWNTADLEVGGYVLRAVGTDDGEKSTAANNIVLMDTPGGLNPDLSYGSVSDIDGNTYGTIEIGTQVWMASAI
jgi:hypothetical protein